MKFFNTLTRQTDTFESLNAGKVKMYSCGPTVYDYAHIGNFRSFLAADLARRVLELVGYEVQHVMNITDVGHMTDSGEDKMQEGAQRIKEAKKSGTVPADANIDGSDPYQIAEFFTEAFVEDGKKLGLKVVSEPENMPKATEHIPQMQDWIHKLIDKGHAYVGPDGVVYYSVESFEDYGALSGNSLEDLRAGQGGRVSEEELKNKRHPADFLLWKPDASHIMKWDSPWGAGYPGWHLECSVMSTELLDSDIIDIHTGGEDLIFPHHECEIAQTRGYSGEDTFAKFWLHTRFLMVDGKKMSKSEGTFYTVRNVLDGKVLDEDGKPMGKQVAPAVLRYELLRTHYRSNQNFSAKGLREAAKFVAAFNRLYTDAKSAAEGEYEVTLTHPVLNDFVKALSDDLNISQAMAGVNTWLSEMNSQLAEGKDPELCEEIVKVCEKLDTVLGVLSQENEDGEESVEVRWARELDEARTAKDYDKADQIRQQILDSGYKVRTTKEGTVVEKDL